MPSAVPAFSDIDSARAAEAELSALQKQLDEAWLRWGVLTLADVFASHPLLDSIFLSDQEHELGPAIFAGIFEPGLRSDPLSHGLAFKLNRDGKFWSPDRLAETAAADKVLRHWSQDPRSATFLRAAASQIKITGKEWLAVAPTLDAAALCSFIGRPDIWASLEGAQIAAGAPSKAGAPSGTPARI